MESKSSQQVVLIALVFCLTTCGSSSGAPGSTTGGSGGATKGGDGAAVATTGAAVEP